MDNCAIHTPTHPPSLGAVLTSMVKTRVVKGCNNRHKAGGIWFFCHPKCCRTSGHSS